MPKSPVGTVSLLSFKVFSTKFPKSVVTKSAVALTTLACGTSLKLPSPSDIAPVVVSVLLEDTAPVIFQVELADIAPANVADAPTPNVPFDDTFV